MSGTLKAPILYASITAAQHRKVWEA